ncbi:hypothetical protein KCU67_g55, partial [Aureobasidium melanogenum]
MDSSGLVIIGTECSPRKKWWNGMDWSLNLIDSRPNTQLTRVFAHSPDSDVVTVRTYPNASNLGNDIML